MAQRRFAFCLPFGAERLAALFAAATAAALTAISCGGGGGSGGGGANGGIATTPSIQSPDNQDIKFNMNVKSVDTALKEAGVEINSVGNGTLTLSGNNPGQFGPGTVIIPSYKTTAVNSSILNEPVKITSNNNGECTTAPAKLTEIFSNGTILRLQDYVKKTKSRAEFSHEVPINITNGALQVTGFMQAVGNAPLPVLTFKNGVVKFSQDLRYTTNYSIKLFTPDQTSYTNVYKQIPNATIDILERKDGQGEVITIVPGLRFRVDHSASVTFAPSNPSDKNANLNGAMDISLKFQTNQWGNVSNGVGQITNTLSIVPQSNGVELLSLKTEVAKATYFDINFKPKFGNTWYLAFNPTEENPDGIATVAFRREVALPFNARQTILPNYQNNPGATVTETLATFIDSYAISGTDPNYIGLASTGYEDSNKIKYNPLLRESYHIPLLVYTTGPQKPDCNTHIPGFTGCPVISYPAQPYQPTVNPNTSLPAPSF